MKRLYCLIVLSLLCGRLSAQHLHSFDFRDASLAAVLDTLAAVQDEYSISFIHNELEHLRISARIKNQTIKDAVEKVCKGQPLKVKTRSKQIFVQYKPEKDFSERVEEIFEEYTNLDIEEKIKFLIFCQIKSFFILMVVIMKKKKKLF